MATKHTTAVPTTLAAKPLKTFRPAQAGETYASGRPASRAANSSYRRTVGEGVIEKGE